MIAIAVAMIASTLPAVLTAAETAPALSEMAYGETTATLIRDNRGHTWAPTGANLITAFRYLQTGSELWIPPGNYTISSQNLAIAKHGVKIHGSGNSTKIMFANNARLISGLYASSTSDWTRYQYGVNNLLLENFSVSGKGSIELVLGDYTKLQGIYAHNISSSRPAAIRFILPLKDPYCRGLTVKNCHIFRSTAHGFQINGVAPNGNNTLANVLFEDCSASWAGFLPTGQPSGNRWSTGFDLGEGYSGCAVTTPSTVVRNCQADHNWECGFHIETAVKRSLTLVRCQADYNGQKRVYNPSDTEFFSSGFVAENGVRLYYCSASYNTNFGVMNRYSPLIVGLTGTGNWNGLRRQ